MGLPSELMAKLELLRVATRRVHSGRYAARTRSRRLGAGIDFADHRAYTPGDDLKYVDWTLYGRLEQLMIRLSEEETELPVHLLVDLSKSMDHGVGPDSADTKSLIARTSAAALSYVALSNLDQVTIWPFAGALGPPLALPRKRSAVLKVWEHLEGLELPGGSDVLGAATAWVQRPHQRGVVVLISDLAMEGWDKALEMLVHDRNDVGLVHLQAPSELQLPLKGERFDLVDAESGEVLRGVTRAEVEALRAELPKAQVELERFCRRRGIAHVSTVTGDPTDLEHLVLTLFRGRGLLR